MQCSTLRHLRPVTWSLLDVGSLQSRLDINHLVVAVFGAMLQWSWHCTQSQELTAAWPGPLSPPLAQVRQASCPEADTGGFSCMAKRQTGSRADVPGYCESACCRFL